MTGLRKSNVQKITPSIRLSFFYQSQILCRCDALIIDCREYYVVSMYFLSWTIIMFVVTVQVSISQHQVASFFSAFNVNVVIGLCVAKVIIRLYQYSPVCVTHSSPKNTSQENLTVQITHYDQITYIKSWNTFFSGIECFWKYFHNKQFPVKRFYFSITLIYQTKSETSHLINCQTVCDVKSVIMTLHRRATAL